MRACVCDLWGWMQASVGTLRSQLNSTQAECKSAKAEAARLGEEPVGAKQRLQQTQNLLVLVRKQKDALQASNANAGAAGVEAGPPPPASPSRGVATPVG